MEKYRMQLKYEPQVVNIKKEDIASDSSDNESTYNADFNSSLKIPNYDIPLVKVELDSNKFVEEDMKIKSEDGGNSDDSSDRFIEPCAKSKKLKDYDFKKNGNEIEKAFFTRDYKEAYIKDNIKVEENIIGEDDIKVEKFIDVKESMEVGEYIDGEEHKEIKKYLDDEDHIDVVEHEIKLETTENLEGNKRHTTDDIHKTTKTWFECNLCTYRTLVQSSLKKHVSLHEDRSTVPLYFCTKCSYRTKQRCHLKRHDLVHQDINDEDLFKCAHCNFKTKQKCTLRRHLNYVHTDQLRNNSVHDNQHRNSTTSVKTEELKCSDCSYKTFKRGLMISHMDKHKDTRDATNLYICDVCSFSTKYRRNLRIHLEIHKESETLQIFECKLCDFRTRIGYCLRRHLLSRKHLLAAGKMQEYCPRNS